MGTVWRVTTTCSDESEAKTVAEILLAEKLIACAQRLPIHSIYRWQGEIKEGSEVLLILKTSRPDEVVAKLDELHSYDIPMITKEEVSCNAAYAQWVTEQCQ